MRGLTGFFQAFLNPAAYSIIADYFPPHLRTRASAIFNLGIYFGGAMASISQIMISNLGWRLTYTIVAIIGGGFSVLGLFFIKNPKRGRWDMKKQNVIPQSTEASGP